MDEFEVYLDFSHIPKEVLVEISIFLKWLTLRRAGRRRCVSAKSPASHAKYLWAQERVKIMIVVLKYGYPSRMLLAQLHFRYPYLAFPQNS